MTHKEKDSKNWGVMVEESGVDEDSDRRVQVGYLHLDEALVNWDQEQLDQMSEREGDMVQVALAEVTWAEVHSVEEVEGGVILGYREIETDLGLGLQVREEDRDELFVGGLPEPGDVIWVKKDTSQWVERAEIWRKSRVD